MSALTAPADVRVRPATSALFLVGAALTIAGSFGFIAMNGMEPREAYLNPIGIAGTAAAAFGCLVLTMGLAQWNTSLPRWAVLSSAAGVWFAGATAVSQATVFPAAGVNLDNDTFRELFFESTWVLAGLAPKSLFCLIGFLTIAVIGWRQRSIPRLAALGFGLAAVVSIFPPFPPGMILASLALILVAHHDKRSTRNA